MKHLLTVAVFVLVLFQSCRKDNEIVTPTETEVDTPISNEIIGFYLLNEANWGSNKSTLDYYDYTTGTYIENIFADANPTVVKELGDVGNDLQIYGSKLYAVINASNKIEVMNVDDTKKLGQIEVNNGRYITFHNGKGYVSSYAGPIQFDNTNKGEIIEFDTTTLAITRRVTVGYQPEELAVVANKLYVANSGGYLFPDYDNTISVIDLITFTEIKKIEVAINLHRLKKSKNNKLYISSRGDYGSISSKLFAFDPITEKVTDTFDFPISNFSLNGDSAYIISSSTDWSTGISTIHYKLLNLQTHLIDNENFISDGTDSNIRIPYGIAIHPLNGDIYITDAIDYVSPGKLFAFDRSGRKKWEVITGDIPAHITFRFK